jgi:hypothetical protein
MKSLDIPADKLIRVAPLGNTMEPVILLWRARPKDRRRVGILCPQESYTIWEESTAEPGATPIYPFKYAILYPEYAVILRPQNGNPGRILIRHPYGKPGFSEKLPARPVRGGADFLLEYNPKNYSISVEFADKLPNPSVSNRRADLRDAINDQADKALVKEYRKGGGR